MEKRIISEDEFWRQEAIHRKSDNIFILRVIGKKEDNKEDSREIHLDIKEQEELFKFMKSIEQYYKVAGRTSEKRNNTK